MRHSGVVNAASFLYGAVAPGEFVTITGTNLGPANPVMGGSERGLGGTKVTFSGIEAFLTFTQNLGSGQAWALNDDGTFNSPDSKVGRGGWIVFWATGQGSVTPAGQDGEITTTPKNVNLPVSVLIDGIEAPLIQAVLIYTGEVQIAARVPGSSRSGDVPLLLNIGGASSRNDVTISVK